MSALLQAAHAPFDWHVQEIYDSIRPQISALIIALLSYIIFQMSHIRRDQKSDSPRVAETQENVRRIANGRSVHHDQEEKSANGIPPMEATNYGDKPSTNG